ncbi:LD-carboxypeptidase [Candidatus Midichloria mitochondrii]|nr:LD-carboxypeptidase [Candidatus Midichloria mitochondrii]
MYVYKSGCSQQLFREPKKLNWLFEGYGKHGYKSYIAKDIFAPTLFCANTSEYRLNNLVETVNDTTFQVIWCLRGGYGSARIFTKLDELVEELKQRPTKIFVGFSDATAISLFLYQKLGWNTVIHGLNYNQISDSMDGKNNARTSKEIVGKITGGNLSILQTSIGTNWEIGTADKILIIEDVAEPPYRIDRMLEHLYQAKKLDSLKAVVFGAFHQCGDKVIDALNRIALVLENKSVPVFKTEMIGHGYYNYPFIYGSNTGIIANSEKRVYNEARSSLIKNLARLP